MNFSDVGNLMCLPFETISVPASLQKLAHHHNYLIQANAKVVATEGRNWLPLLVIETDLDQYQLIGNTFGYAVAEAAELEKVWCIVCEDNPQTQAIAQTLSQDRIPKTNLSTASREEIATALDYLISQPKSPLKGVSVAVATNRISTAPRQYWDSFKPIAQLGCKITKGKKLKTLEQIFYLTPEPLPELITDRALLDSFSVKELQGFAGKRGLKGYSKLKRASLIDLLTQASD